jgi:hypothetical protein
LLLPSVSGIVVHEEKEAADSKKQILHPLPQRDARCSPQECPLMGMPEASTVEAVSTHLLLNRPTHTDTQSAKKELQIARCDTKRADPRAIHVQLASMSGGTRAEHLVRFSITDF